MRRYVVKNEKDKKYSNLFGSTDYDIPMFGFKSAFFIFFTILISFLICIYLNQYIKSLLFIPITVGLVSGFSVSFTQYFIERKIGFCKQFVIVGLMLSIISGLFIFII